MMKIICLVGFLSLAACARTQVLNPPEKNEIEIMVYNVENLFDTAHDKGKDDWTFLPANTKGKKAACAKVKSSYYREQCFATDWTKEKLATKLGQIRDVVMKERKYLPTFLALAEIENAAVVSMLAKELGYSSQIVTNSPDERGIDLAILYNSSKRIVLKSHRELVVKTNSPTRNILEAEFVIDEKYPLTIFVNHWPSQGNPTGDRLDAARTLIKRTGQIAKKNANHAILVTGDFNTLPRDLPNPFGDLIVDGFVDIHDMFMAEQTISSRIKDRLPKGTYYYARNNEWNMLDRLFANQALVNGKGLKINLESYHIYAPAFASEGHPKGGSIPRRYEHNEVSGAKAGYSDHFPVVVRLISN
jgi:endonuclease/exonuclease/phosphatase family metal-dependent hydrolase